MNLQDNPRLRILLLCSLYFSQGMPFGFVTITLTAYFGAEGLSAADVGRITALCTLPWSFKYIWGPIVDFFSDSPMGRRRPWVIFAQMLMSVTLMAMIGIPDMTSDLKLLGWMIFTHNVFASLQDVAADALAIDMVPENQLGRANGMMYGSSYLGAAFGGAGIGLIVSTLGMQTALIVQVTVLFAILVISFIALEHPKDKYLQAFRSQQVARDSSIAAALGQIFALLKNLVGAFFNRNALLGLIIALTAKFGIGLTTVISPLMCTQELGWTQQDYSIAMGGFATLLGFVGAVLSGFITDWVGPRRLTITFVVLQASLWMGFGSTSHLWEHRWYVIGFLCAQDFFYAMFSVAIFAQFMQISSAVVGASQFTAYMAFMNLASTMGADAAGKVTEWFAKDYTQIYFYTGVAHLSVLIWLVLMRRVEKKKE